MSKEDRPVTREEFETLESRTRKMEDYFFAGKVLSSVIVAVSIFLGWVAQNWVELKTAALHLLGAK